MKCLGRELWLEVEVKTYRRPSPSVTWHRCCPSCSCSSLRWMVGSSTAARPPPSLSGSGASSSSPSAWPSSSAMTHADRIAYMSAALDEEISLGLQEDEFEEAAATILSCSGGLSPALPPDAPLPGDIPLPFGSWSSSLGCASQAEVNPGSSQQPDESTSSSTQSPTVVLLLWPRRLAHASCCAGCLCFCTSRCSAGPTAMQAPLPSTLRSGPGWGGEIAAC